MTADAAGRWRTAVPADRAARAGSPGPTGWPRRCGRPPRPDHRRQGRRGGMTSVAGSATLRCGHVFVDDRRRAVISTSQWVPCPRPRCLESVLPVRRLLTFALSLSASATVLVALPTDHARAPTAAPRPVEPGLEQVPLSGADPRDLRSPALTGKRFSVMGVTWTPDAAVGRGRRARPHPHRRRVVGLGARRGRGRRRPRRRHRRHRAAAAQRHLADLDRPLRRRAGARSTRSSGAAPRDVKIELVDPGTSPADRLPAVPSGTAHAAAGRPEIISRAQWGADESIRRGTPDYTSR